MSGRALAFSDAEIIRMGREEFVPVAGDDWYQRRRQDAEGEFFRNVADQGPQKGEGGATRQGIYILTAGGKLLEWKNAGQNPQVMRDALQAGLRKWKHLPESERKPGAIQVGEPGKLDTAYVRTPPPGGLIVNVYTRALDRMNDLKLVDAECKPGAGDEASRDHLWLTEAEWKSLVPANAKTGDRFPLPAKIGERILRFHLVDNTRGEPPIWRREDIRSSELRLTVEAATAGEVRLRLEGSALLATDADVSKAGRGYDASMLGYLRYDAKQKRMDRVEVVVAGDHWGTGPYTRRYARPGKTPLGIAFELARGDSPADTVAPQAAREIGEYLGRRD